MNKKSNKKINIEDQPIILDVKHLKKHFKVGTGKTKILVKAVDDISFSIHKKEVFGLVGESGCGKTTASRTIIRLYRPTSGLVTFEGTVIGAGDGKYYDNIARAREQYRIDKIRLNPRRNQIYEINLKYDELLRELEFEKEKLDLKYKEQKDEINAPIGEYKSKRFEAKNNYNLAKDNANYEYMKRKNALYGQTVNEALHEYESIRKNLEKTFSIKYKSLDDSVGLSPEAREKRKEMLQGIHDQELAELELKFRDAIEIRSENLLPKEEYKVQLQALNLDYKAKKQSLKDEYMQNLSKIEFPDKDAINMKLVEAKEAHHVQLTELKKRRDELKKQRKLEISQVDAKQEINFEKLLELKAKHKEYIQEQRGLIRDSRKLHKSPEAIEQTKKMQMIFQDPISSLNPRMTVGEIVSEGLVINGEKDEDLIREKVIQTLELVGLAPEYISRYPHEFSGGQRQRIGIARALIMNPSFIIADEPISALDVSIRAQVLNLLTDLKEKLDLSILFIAHDLSVVRFFCDRIAVMFNGRIVELAPTSDLFAHPLHPYTRSLLSAVPQPDPDTEKNRKRITYNPFLHDYRVDKPILREVSKGHFVYCNNAEYEEIKKKLGEKNA